MQSKGAKNGRIVDRLKRFWSGKKRIRLLLTLELAGMLPAGPPLLFQF